MSEGRANRKAKNHGFDSMAKMVAALMHGSDDMSVVIGPVVRGPSDNRYFTVSTCARMADFELTPSTNRRAPAANGCESNSSWN